MSETKRDDVARHDQVKCISENDDSDSSDRRKRQAHTEWNDTAQGSRQPAALENYSIRTQQNTAEHITAHIRTRRMRTYGHRVKFFFLRRTLAVVDNLLRRTRR